MEKTSILQYLTCPITKLIFSDPVMAEDGYIYENLAIKHYLTRNNTSPVTGEKISSYLTKAVQLKMMIGEFIGRHPECKADQFYSKKPFYLFSKDFFQNIQDKQFDNLKCYTMIMLNSEYNKETLFEIVCKNCPDDIIKCILDNSIDYDIYDRRKLKPLHIACKYASKEVIVYLAKKGVDLNCDDLHNETPLGYLILYNKKNVIPEFIKCKNDSNNVNVNVINKSGYSPVHYIIKEGDIDTFNVLMQNHLNVGLVSQKLGGINLLQYAFRECPNSTFINFLIDQKITLDVDIDPKTSCEQLLYLNQNLTKKEKQELVLNYLKKVLSIPVIVDNFIDSLN